MFPVLIVLIYSDRLYPTDAALMWLNQPLSQDPTYALSALTRASYKQL